MPNPTGFGWGDALGFVGDLFGGFGGGGGRDVANTNLQLQNYATNLNYHMWQRSAEEQMRQYAESNRINQHNFNLTRSDQARRDRNQIQWRVADANAAGIHPLVAMGLQPGGGPAMANPSSPGGPMPGSVGAAGLSSTESSGLSGQNLFNATRRLLTRDEKAQVAENRMMTAFNQEREIALGTLQIEESELRNALLRSQLAKESANPTAAAPTFNGEASAPVGTAQFQPAMPTVRAKGVHGQEAGHITDYGYVRRGNKIFVVPSKDWKDRGEDSILQEGMWALRNIMMPLISRNWRPNPPNLKEHPNRPGYMWQWNGSYWDEVKGR